MNEKQFDYSEQLESELIQKIEESKEYDAKLDTVIRLDYLEDKLRSQKVAKQFKQWLGLKDNEFNPIRRVK